MHPILALRALSFSVFCQHTTSTCWFKATNKAGPRHQRTFHQRSATPSITNTTARWNHSNTQPSQNLAASNPSLCARYCDARHTWHATPRTDSLLQSGGPVPMRSAPPHLQCVKLTFARASLCCLQPRKTVLVPPLIQWLCDPCSAAKATESRVLGCTLSPNVLVSPSTTPSSLRL
jgi:hypothetical protein